MMEGFADRREAGRALAEQLDDLRDRDDVLVLGLPRGGVPVAAAVAEELRAPLDVLVVRKLGVPWQPELAMGALGPYDTRVLNDVVVNRSRISPQQIDEVAERESAELARQESLYREGRPPLDLTDRTVVIVDDGLATGASARAAVCAARSQQPRAVLLAAPVGAAATVRRLAREADTVVCALVPPDFLAVGEWYEDFAQVTDAEVLDALAASRNAARTVLSDRPPRDHEERGEA